MGEIRVLTIILPENETPHKIIIDNSFGLKEINITMV